MNRQNIFDGIGTKARFTSIIYEKFKSREWVTYADVYAEKYPGKKANKLSGEAEYGEMKKAFMDLRNLINEKVGKDSFESGGNNRNWKIRYIGNDPDPLGDLKNAVAVRNLQKYWDFCQDSAGFFPKSWLEHFFANCTDLISINNRRRNGQQIISSSVDRILTNIEYLPELYEAIMGKKVLTITYKPFLEEQMTITFHPHYLKEFNGRWYLLGHAEGRLPELGFNIALDRISDRPTVNSEAKYVDAPKLFYDNLFSDIVGVTHPDGSHAVDIIVRTHSLYIYKLTETKPIHPSQTVLRPFAEYSDGQYGEFCVHVVPNSELIGRILQMSGGLEIMSPDSVREMIRQRVMNMAEQYKV